MFDSKRRSLIKAEIKARSTAAAAEPSTLERARQALRQDPRARVKWRRAGKHGSEIFGNQRELGATAEKIGALMSAIDISSADANRPPVIRKRGGRNV